MESTRNYYESLQAIRGALPKRSIVTIAGLVGCSPQKVRDTFRRKSKDEHSMLELEILNNARSIVEMKDSITP